MYRLIERSTGKSWAGKFIRSDSDVSGRSLVRHEVEVMNALRHPHLQKLRDVFEMPGELVLVLELYVSKLLVQLS